MRKNNKAYGSLNEKRCQKSLEAVGYMVTKSGASLGMYDLIAIHPVKGTYCIQVKSGGWSYIKQSLRKEWLGINHPLPPYHQAIFVCWVTPKKGMKRDDTGWYYWDEWSMDGSTGCWEKGLPWEL